ncbi:MAG: hypothetical protein JWO76_2560 [Nocardioides sp.]|nr:hypothetical protein [Nocardioides sp.]
MSERPSGAPAEDLATILARRQATLVGSAIALGVMLSVVGLVDGLVMALKRHEGACPPGKVFPAGTTDFTCFVHPDAAEGIAVAVTSVMLGIVIALVGVVATATVKARAAAVESDVVSTSSTSEEGCPATEEGSSTTGESQGRP